MKIIMFGFSSDETPFCKKWEEKNQDKIKCVTEPLTADNVDMVAGFDGVSTKQVVSIGDESVYHKLNQFGIKFISLRSVGYNVINFNFANKYEIKIANVPAYSPRAIAENGLTVALNLLRHISIIQERERQLDFTIPQELMTDEIYNKTVGIIGLGHIGTASAQLYRALGCKVIGYDPIYNASNEPFVEYTTFKNVINKSDIITLHTPLNSSTHNMIGKSEFDGMKKNVIFINQARGGLVDTQAMIAALKSGKIGGVGLDVLTSEAQFFWKKLTSAQELPEDYQELAKMPNAIITPHSAYYTKTAVRNMVEQSMTDIKRFLAGKKPLYLVDL